MSGPALQLGFRWLLKQIVKDANFFPDSYFILILKVLKVNDVIYFVCYSKWSESVSGYMMAFSIIQKWSSKVMTTEELKLFNLIFLAETLIYVLLVCVYKYCCFW